MASEISFAKYHGCANDFVVIDDMDGSLSRFFHDAELMTRMCDRHLGVGADAVLRLTRHDKHDFLLENFSHNCGTASGLCGNGSRCAVLFAADKGIIKKNKGTFATPDGSHDYNIAGNNLVSIGLADVLKCQIVHHNEDEFYVNVGSPHLVKFVSNLEQYDVKGEGPRKAWSGSYADPDVTGVTGVNVNYVENVADSTCRIRTYERTVSAETEACGTGSVSAAVVSVFRDSVTRDSVMRDGVTRDGVTRDGALKHSVVRDSVPTDGVSTEDVIRDGVPKDGVARHGDGSQAFRERTVHMINSGGTLTVSFREEPDRFSHVVLSGPAEKVFSGVFFL